MKTSLLICAIVLSTVQIFAEPVLVNVDGNYSLVAGNGATSPAIIPNDTHSVAFNNGPTSTMVNADGTHSILFSNGLSSVFVGANDGHAVIIDVHSTSVGQVSQKPRHKHHPKSVNGHKKHKPNKKHKR